MFWNETQILRKSSDHERNGIGNATSQFEWSEQAFRGKDEDNLCKFLTTSKVQQLTKKATDNKNQENSPLMCNISPKSRNYNIKIAQNFVLCFNGLQCG